MFFTQNSTSVPYIPSMLSILHYASVGRYFGSQGPWGPMWGTVGSGLTPGSRPDGRNWTFLILPGSRAGKLKTAQWFVLEYGAV